MKKSKTRHKIFNSKGTLRGNEAKRSHPLTVKNVHYHNLQQKKSGVGISNHHPWVSHRHFLPILLPQTTNKLFKLMPFNWNSHVVRRQEDKIGDHLAVVGNTHDEGVHALKVLSLNRIETKVKEILGSMMLSSM